MKKADIVVIGGGPAGITAAITARRKFPEKTTLLLRRENRVMIPCGIPYIFGTLGSAEENLVPDAILVNEKIELMVGEVTGIDPKKKIIFAVGEEIGYDRLIIATGSSPYLPPIPGADNKGVYPIVKDMDFLQDLRKRLQKARDIVIIGGGFIGIEFADEINKMGNKNITVVEIAPHCLSLAYDDEFCMEAEKVISSRGVHLRVSTKVTSIEGSPESQRVVLSDGDSLPADVIIIGIGAVANNQLAKEANLETGKDGTIKVDRTMRTSDPNIFACGDCARKISFFGGRPSTLKLASIATLEARIAGTNVYGIRRENPGTVGVWSTAIGEHAMGTAGLTEAMGRAWGYDVISTTVEGVNRHPGVMPGGTKIRIKLVFDAHSGVLLGGQARGDATAGEIINIISACVQKRMTAEDIATFQLGTHPALTASPIAYGLVNAAEMAITKIKCKF